MLHDSGTAAIQTSCFVEPNKFRKMYFRGYQHAHWVCLLLPQSSFAHDGQESEAWLHDYMAAFGASLHTPSSLVCSAAKSINSSGDELSFDENIPLAGCKEQDEEEDEETIGDVWVIAHEK